MYDVNMEEDGFTMVKEYRDKRFTQPQKRYTTNTFRYSLSKTEEIVDIDKIVALIEYSR